MSLWSLIKESVTQWSEDYAPSISDDGVRILFLSRLRGRPDIRPQAFIMHTDGTGRRQITADTDGVQSAVLSGDGRMAWVLTETARLGGND